MDLLYLMRREMLRRNYSPKTIISYLTCFKNFLKRCHKEPRKITKYDVKKFLYDLCENKKSASTLNVHLQAIKFALEQILNKKFFVKLPFSKSPLKLPVVLTKEEVFSLLDVIKNPKHKLMISLLYSAGLRVNELVSLKVEHLEFDNDFGWVRSGKGNKDRIFIIAKDLKEKLIYFVEQNNLDSWLFKGYKNNHLSPRTVQNIVKNAKNLSKISKNAHPHTLRHSFATHLIEDGCDLITVQMLLGHFSPQTTMIYVHTASPRMLKVKSPYDEIKK